MSVSHENAAIDRDVGRDLLPLCVLAVDAALARRLAAAVTAIDAALSFRPLLYSA